MIKGKKLFWLKIVTALAVLALCIGPALASFPAAYADSRDGAAPVADAPAADAPVVDTAAVTTDKFDYQHGETASIAGAGFTPGSDVTVSVTAPDGKLSQWTVQADSTGAVTSGYTFGSGPDGLFTAVLSDGKVSATTVFTDPAVVLYPNGDVDTELDEHGSGSSNWTQVDDTLPGNDGDSTYVYTSDNHWKTDLYSFTDLPAGYDLGSGGSGSDTTDPDKPTPTSTTPINTWTNNPDVVMTWNSVTDPGGVASGASVQIVTVAKATSDDGCGHGQPTPPDGQVKFAVVDSVTWHPGDHHHPGYYTYDYKTYNPVNPPGTQLDDGYQTYTYTLDKDANNDDWTVNSINNLIAGIQLKNEGSGDARATQLYVVVTPGSGGASGIDGYNWQWDGTPPVIPTTPTQNVLSYGTTLPDGSHIFYLNAQDNAGNKSGTANSGLYLIDTTNPTLTKLIDDLAAKNGWYNIEDVGSDNELDVTLTASDINGTTPVSGVDYIIYKVGSGTPNNVPNTTTPDSVNTPGGILGDAKAATQTVYFVIPTKDGLIYINQGPVTLAHSTQDVAGTPYTLPTQTVLIDTQAPVMHTDVSGTTNGSGWYRSNVNATITGEDPTPGSGMDTIIYNVNGGGNTTETNGPLDPNTNTKPSDFTTSQITVATEGHNTLNYTGTDWAGNDTGELTYIFYIDKTKPTVTSSLSGTGGTPATSGWYTSPVGVTLTATDLLSGVDNIQFKSDGSGWTTIDAPVDTSVTPNQGPPTFTPTPTPTLTVNDEGRTKVTYNATDVAGNTSSQQYKWVKIDSVGPELYKKLFGTEGENGWYTSNVNFLLTAIDGTSGVNQINYQAVNNATQQQQSSGQTTAWRVGDQGFPIWMLTGSVNGDGTYTLYHAATDVAGNSSINNANGPDSCLLGERVGENQQLKIDQTAPVVIKTVPLPDGKNGWYISDVNGYFDVDDATSGIQWFKYSINGAETTETADGQYYFVISQEGADNTLIQQAKDMAGNLSDPHTQYYNIDKTAPTLAKTIDGSDAKTGWYNISDVGTDNKLDVVLTASDYEPGSGVDYIKFKVGLGTEETSVNPDIIGDGKDYSHIGNFVINTQDGSGPINQGTVTLNHSAFDVAGNEGSGTIGASQEIKIDTVAPTLAKAIDGSDAKTGWYNISDVGTDNKLDVVLTASDFTPGSGVDHINFEVDSQGVQTVNGATGNFVINTQDGSGPINQGTVTLNHSAFDVAGNEGSGTIGAFQEIKIDTVAPTLVKDADRTGASEITVTLLGTDATSGVDYIRYSIDGGVNWAYANVVDNQGPNSMATTFVLTGAGEYNLGHLVLDVAGNQYVLPDQVITLEGPTADGTAPPPTMLVITMDINGTIAEYPVTPEGRLIADARTISPDGNVTLEIPAGTLVLNKDLTPTYLNQDYDIVLKEAATPAAPAGYQMIAAYEAFPTGVTFSPDARFIITYDQEKLPKDSSAVIAYYDEAARTWQPLETAGYVAAGGIEIPNTVVSRVGHFTYFAVLAKLPAGK